MPRNNIIESPFRARAELLGAQRQEALSEERPWKSEARQSKPSARIMKMA